MSYGGPVQLILYKSGYELERALGGQYRGPGLSRALRQGVRGADGTWRQYVHVAATDPSLLFDLTHEGVHLVQAQMGLDDTFGSVPAWLIEGMPSTWRSRRCRTRRPPASACGSPNATAA